MKMLPLTARLLGCAAVLTLFAGCMDFEYSGREFAPLGSGSVPKYFEGREKLPAGRYSIIGRAQITAKERTDKEDIKLLFLDEAALRGADAVCVVEFQRIRVGLFEGDGIYAAPSSGNSNPANLTPDGAPVMTNLDGTVKEQTLTAKPSALVSEHNTAERLVVKALFLKDRVELEKIISAREKQLDDLVNRPASLPGKSR